jgi:hypothetical protein
MHAMVAIWAVFALVLFVAEPLFLHRLFTRQIREKPRIAYAVIQRAHWLLLLLSLIVTAGAVAGVHG